MLMKIYGERNTGTNYLAQLLEKHVLLLPEEQQKNISIFPSPSLSLCRNDSEQLEAKYLGWKHRLIDKEFLQECGFEKNAGIILTLTKNPYSWLLSLHKRPYAPIHLRNKVISWDKEGYPLSHSIRNIKIIRKMRGFGRLGKIFLSHYPQWSEYEEIEFSDFIRAKWFTQFNENHVDAFKNPVKLWNMKNKAYIELAKQYNVLSFTYEELIRSPEVVVRTIFSRLGIELEKFNNVLDAAKKEDINFKDHSFYRDYYLNERWRERLSKKEINWISSQLDPSVMKSFGYQFL